MAIIKNFAEITTHKALLAAAALASLVALVSLCFIWFHQPKMPASVRQMGKYKE